MQYLLLKVINLLWTFNRHIVFIHKFTHAREVWRKTYLYPRFLHFGEGSFMCDISKLIGEQFISIGKNCKFNDGIFLTVWEQIDKKRGNTVIEIGNNCNFGAYNHITAINSIKIGDNCLTGKWVTITDNSHGTTDISELQIPPLNRKVTSKGKVIIGTNVWIGDKATILPGVTIGNGAVIAANSVITKDVPPMTVWGGNPAKKIK